jgi:hypothetical protein
MPPKCNSPFFSGIKKECPTPKMSLKTSKPNLSEHVRLGYDVEHMTSHWGFTVNQIATIVRLGGKNLLNHVILYTNPLLSFGYDAKDIYKIAITDNPTLKFEFLIQNHVKLIEMGFMVKSIPDLIFQNPTHVQIPVVETQQSSTVQELSRQVDTPSPYSQAIDDEPPYPQSDLAWDRCVFDL